MKPVKRFNIYRDEEIRIETNGELLGRGAQFPNGSCYVDWNREVFPPEDRLDHEHVSRYGSLSDVEQGTGGVVQVVDEGNA
ncbi:hypothetical protein [Halorubrum sp. GN11GM_10-3_MGM]|uniref:hypothetical protein n=1 Tax=Halorubrum sp. GN11GM_10-3_MGM TaxID=2518111 RepID=UPI0010F5734D|nr:hypothetical protein [Halorubrum sp. GN11GM_10-3_MGM]TKX70939.1 hypothetical protein EXE40_08565 [Halorubrum sp. GN11GM_10-3_MGM]